jgi:hypothetical protein
MKHLGTEMKQQQIDWRRAKVLELSSQGYSEREIAEKLQPLASVTVHREETPPTPLPPPPDDSPVFPRGGEVLEQQEVEEQEEQESPSEEPEEEPPSVDEGSEENS